MFWTFSLLSNINWMFIIHPLINHEFFRTILKVGKSCFDGVRYSLSLSNLTNESHHTSNNQLIYTQTDIHMTRETLTFPDTVKLKYVVFRDRTEWNHPRAYIASRKLWFWLFGHGKAFDISSLMLKFSLKKLVGLAKCFQWAKL